MPGFREILGWLITVLGLAMTGLLVWLALNRMIFEAMALSLPSILVFRGGLGLVRMGWASRLAWQLADEESRSSQGL